MKNPEFVMNKVKLFFLCFLIITLFLPSCTDDGTLIVNPKSSQQSLDTVRLPEIRPKSLNVGNIWVYKVQYYDSLENVIFTGFDTVKILKIDYMQLSYDDVVKPYMMLLPTFTEYHSICPKDIVIFSCTRALVYYDNPKYFEYFSFAPNSDLFEDYQPYPKYNNSFDNYSQTSKSRCGSCISYGIRVFKKSNGELASAMCERTNVQEIELSWDKYLKLDGYYINHRLFVMDTVVRNIISIENLTCKVNKYLCEQYWARDIGLLNYKWFKLNENFHQSLLVTSDLLEFIERKN